MPRLSLSFSRSLSFYLALSRSGSANVISELFTNSISAYTYFRFALFALIWILREREKAHGQGAWPAKWPNLANGYAGRQSIWFDQWPSNNIVFVFISIGNILDTTLSVSVLLSLILSLFARSLSAHLAIRYLQSAHPRQLDFVIDAGTCKYYCLICHKANILQHAHTHTVKHTLTHVHTSMRVCVCVWEAAVKMRSSGILCASDTQQGAGSWQLSVSCVALALV